MSGWTGVIHRSPWAGHLVVPLGDQEQSCTLRGQARVRAPVSSSVGRTPRGATVGPHGRSPPSAVSTPFRTPANPASARTPGPGRPKASPAMTFITHASHPLRPSRPSGQQNKTDRTQTQACFLQSTSGTAPQPGPRWGLRRGPFRRWLGRRPPWTLAWGAWGTWGRSCLEVAVPLAWRRAVPCGGRRARVAPLQPRPLESNAGVSSPVIFTPPVPSGEQLSRTQIKGLYGENRHE